MATRSKNQPEVDCNVINERQLPKKKYVSKKVMSTIYSSTSEEDETTSGDSEDVHTWMDVYDEYKKWKKSAGYKQPEHGPPGKAKPHNGISNRWYMIVINNPTKDDFLAFHNDDWEYCRAQIEVGDGSKKYQSKGTAHIQAVIYYKNKRVTPFKKYKVGYVEALRCKPAALNYTDKDKTRVLGPWEWGEEPCQGQRNDIIEACEFLRTAKCVDALAFEAPEMLIKYGKGFDRFFSAIQPDRIGKPIVHWRYGESGSGKTEYCKRQHPPRKEPVNWYLKDCSMWWSKYAQQEAVIIDDYEKWEKGFRDFLIFIGGEPYEGEIKYGHVKVNCKYIYITSEFHPKTYFTRTVDSANCWRQVERRLTSITEVKRKVKENKTVYKPVETVEINEWDSNESSSE